MNSPTTWPRWILSVYILHLLLFVLSPVSLLWGHEGHKAVPVKGVVVKGMEVTLSEDVKTAVGLKTAEVDFQEMPEIVRTTATVWIPPYLRAFASSRLSGKVVEVRAHPGNIVEKGQVLSVIQSLEFENLQYMMIQEKQQLELESKDLDRVNRLVDLGILPGKLLIELDLKYKGHMNSYNVMRRKLKTLGLDDHDSDRIIMKGEPVKEFEILAPAAGMIGHTDIRQGKVVGPKDHLFEIHDMTTVWLQGHIMESDLYKVKTGQEVNVRFAAYPGKVFNGKIDLIDFAVDPAQKTIRIWAKITNPDFLLKPGMFGQMELIVRKNEAAIAVPRAAVLSNGEDQFVFIENDESVYELKYITRGTSNESFVEVFDAVLPGDKVIVSGHHQLAALFKRSTLSLSEEARVNMGLVVEMVEERSIQNILIINALTEVPTSGRSVVSASIPGKIDSVLVRLGDEVKKGAPVARLRSLELENIQLEYIQARLDFDLVRASMERIRNITGRNDQGQRILPMKDLIRIETEFKQKQVDLLNLKRQLMVMGLSTETLAEVASTRNPVTYLSILAPSSGIITDMDIVLGQVVEPEDRLINIVDLSPLWVRGHVYEDQIERLGSLDRNVRMRFEGLPGKTISGKIGFTTHNIDSETLGLPIWSELGNTKGLVIPGMRAEMIIIVGKRNSSLAVPVTAILRHGGQHFVFVFKKSENGSRKDIVKRVAVIIGARDDLYIQIISGLRAGDRIAVRGVDMLNTAYMTVQ